MCTQQLIIVGVMEESVYWVIWETNPLGLPSPIFPWVLLLQAMHCRLFTLLLQRQVWKAEPTLQTPLCLVGCPDTKQFCRNEEVQSVDWEKKTFFSKRKPGSRKFWQKCQTLQYLGYTLYEPKMIFKIFVSIFSLVMLLVIVYWLVLHIIQLKMQQDQMVYTGPLVDPWFWCKRS